MAVRESYKVIKEIGDRASRAEGLSFTYLACDRFDYPAYQQNLEVDKFVIKAINLMQCTEKTKELFVREIDMLEFLNQAAQDQSRDPRIPVLLDANREDFWFSYEYMAGRSLEEELVANIPVAEETVLQILAEILELVTWIHDNRIIHRDIKPANIIRSKSTQKLHLIDFGAATPLKLEIINEKPVTVIGTLGYQDPLQDSSIPSNFQNDIYSIGMIAVQALTGNRPDSNMPIMSFAQEPLWVQYAPKTSEKLVKIISRMIIVDQRTRYQTTREVLEDLGFPIPEPIMPSNLCCNLYPNLYPPKQLNSTPILHPHLDPNFNQNQPASLPKISSPALEKSPETELIQPNKLTIALFAIVGLSLIVILALFLRFSNPSQDPKIPTFSPVPRPSLK